MVSSLVDQGDTSTSQISEHTFVSTHVGGNNNGCHDGGGKGNGGSKGCEDKRQ